MSGFGPSQQRTRLAFDAKVMRGLRSPHLAAVHAYASAQEAQAGRTLSPREEEAGLAAVYLVEYRLPILASPSKRIDGAKVWFDLLAGGSYPFSAPHVTCVSRPLPWSTHVHPSSGTVCLGEAWPRARGRMLVAQLVIHVMRLLNLDEPDRGRSYHGFLPEAMRHWREVLGGRPLTPELAYPTLPSELTHAIEPEDTGFRALTSFRPVESGGGFRRIP